MSEPYYVGSYWLGRHESGEACARRAEHFFRLVEHCDPTWTHWRNITDVDEPGASRGGLDAATILRLFDREENRSGPDGFRLSFRVGDTVLESTSVNLRCGSATPKVPSACAVTLPGQGHIAERVLTAPVMAEVLRAMVLAWEPEWGIAASHEHLRQAYGYPIAPGTTVGWVTYFSRERGTVPPLPAPVRIEPVEDRGTLVILTPERFTASNPEHLALAARVHQLLDRAGLVRRLQPHGAK